MGDPWWVQDRAEQFRRFAESDGRTAPLYWRFSNAIAEDAEVLSLLDAAPVQQQRAVLLFASVHHLVLGDPDSDLAGFYPSVHGVDAIAARVLDDPWPAFRDFCMDRRSEVEALIATRTTQTNEVGRVAALAPALELVHRATDQPLSLLEIGTSAGLNLCLDRYRVEYSGGRATVGPEDSPVVIGTRVFDRILPPVSADWVPVADRIGLDLHPIDVTSDEEVRWLEACIFTDRLDRLDRLRAAVQVARTDPPRVEQGDATTDLVRVAGELPGDGPLVVFHSWALSYIDDADAIAADLAGLSFERDVWWISVEPSTAVPDLVVPPRDPRYTPEMAANTVTALMHMTPDGRTDRVLARSHPHLDWIHWMG